MGRIAAATALSFVESSNAKEDRGVTLECATNAAPFEAVGSMEVGWNWIVGKVLAI